MARLRALVPELQPGQRLEDAAARGLAQVRSGLRRSGETRPVLVDPQAEGRASTDPARADGVAQGRECSRLDRGVAGAGPTRRLEHIFALEAWCSIGEGLRRVHRLLGPGALPALAVRTMADFKRRRRNRPQDVGRRGAPKRAQSGDDDDDERSLVHGGTCCTGRANCAGAPTIPERRRQERHALYLAALRSGRSSSARTMTARPTKT
jgi:hypothetical protein